MSDARTSNLQPPTSRLPARYAFTTHPILVYHPSSSCSAGESGKLMGSCGQNVLLASLNADNK